MRLQNQGRQRHCPFPGRKKEKKVTFSSLIRASCSVSVSSVRVGVIVATAVAAVVVAASAADDSRGTDFEDRRWVRRLTRLLERLAVLLEHRNFFEDLMDRDMLEAPDRDRATDDPIFCLYLGGRLIDGPVFEEASTVVASALEMLATLKFLTWMV